MAQSRTTKCLTPEDAVNQLEDLYAGATRALAEAMDHFITTGEPPSRKTRALFRYPLLRITHRDMKSSRESHNRAFGKLEHPGVYETTITNPEPFRSYLLEQLELLMREYDIEIEVEISDQEIPYPYVIERTGELSESGITPDQLARHFPIPHLTDVGDEIADCLLDQTGDGPRPLALFDAARTDFSLRRLVHYTGSDWQHIQRWILLTNYHRYVDQFINWGIGQLSDICAYDSLVLPGNITITPEHTPEQMKELVASSPWNRHQMPAYHLTKEGNDGITLINIGVGPSNAKNITDHLAVIRPNCWLMVGHCAGLRDSQAIGDYVLAHAYLRQDHILDSLVPPEVPIPVLAEVQVALHDAAVYVLGNSGDELKQQLRTGTVVTNDDRNWELRFHHERKRINLSRAIAIDMESGTIATQGFRLRVPYGALLCVSDKPLHGEIKLPGAANAFYETEIGKHLEIGIVALELLQERRTTLHSRKLRSFDELPFR